MAEAAAGSEALQCTVCYALYNTGQRKPIDLGCGHTFCQTCVSSQPGSFRRCPECRAPARSPHVNITLLRLLEGLGPAHQGGAADGPAADGVGVGGGASSSGRGADAPRGCQPPTSSSSFSLWSTLWSLLGTDPAAAAAAAGPSTSAGTAAASDGPTHPPSARQRRPWAAAPAAQAQSQHPQQLQAGLQALQSALPPGGAAASLLGSLPWQLIMALLYLLSPLDIIPDVVPLLGLLDDVLVFVALAVWLWRAHAR